MRAAHGTKVREFGAFRRKSFVVELTGGDGIEAQIELIFPAELKTGFAQGIVPRSGGWMAFGKIGSVSGDFVCNHPLLDVSLVRQAQMFLGRDITKHRCAIPTDHRRANRARNMIVTRRDVGSQRTERVEGSFITPFQLL